MPIDPVKELEALNKKMVFISIVDAPGMILIGLGLFAKFGENPEGLHPIFGNSDITSGMLVVGGVIAGWSLIETIKVLRRKSELVRQLNT